MLTILATHGAYKNVTWAFRRDTGQWVEGGYERSLNDIVAKTAFRVETLVSVY